MTLSIAPAVQFRFRLRFAGHAIFDVIVLKTMLVSLVVFGVFISFLAVLTTVAIFRIVKNGVLIKDRPGQHDDEDGRAAAAASIFDCEDMIGGSPLHLPKPSGPTGTSFTFHVYAPPSIGKEIPKVDLV